MYHKVIIVGNLGRDPEMRYTPAGVAVTDFSVATSEKWTSQDGQAKERTIWWKVSVFGKAGEACNEYLKKGKQVLVEGRMNADPKTGNPRIWNDKDGNPRASFEVTALTVKFLGQRGEQTERASEPHGAGGGSDLAPDEIPF